jgi:predicted RND superfamily exporter protein
MFLASSSSITVISNVILSVIFLKEHLYYIDIIGILIASIGSVMFYQTALDSPPNKYHNKELLLSLYTEQHTIIFLVITALAAIFIYYLDSKIKSDLKRCLGLIQKGDENAPLI